MSIHLINGEFSPQDALDLVTQLIHVKIKYHENKISKNSNEEEIKYREGKIKRLQRELFEFRKAVEENKKSVQLTAEIQVDN